jgi:antitoxin HigA-1
MPRTFAPIHLGEVLLHEFMEPLGLSQNELADTTDVPPRRINQIVHGQRAMTADTALRLSKAFGLSDMFWINMQSRYDAEMARMCLRTICARFTGSRPTGSADYRRVGILVRDEHTTRRSIGTDCQRLPLARWLGDI